LAGAARAAKKVFSGRIMDDHMVTDILSEKYGFFSGKI
jgi:hypothetical protein